MSKNLIGTVKWFDEIKGYGFIQPSNGDRDVFVHISSLQSAGIQKLKEGQKVSYVLVTNKGRQSAVDLTLQ